MKINKKVYKNRNWLKKKCFGSEEKHKNKRREHFLKYGWKTILLNETKYGNSNKIEIELRRSGL